jgi:gliding motility-associated-like protein
MNLDLKHSTILSLLFLLTFCICSTEILAQSIASYSEGKESYRVIAMNQSNETIESVSNSVELIRSTTVYFPNAFTPDNDGANDQFGAVGINVEEYQLKIFNRWGELLFESQDISSKWDGTFKGTPVPDGVYVYTFFAKELVTGKPISKTGTVTLLL